MTGGDEDIAPEFLRWEGRRPRVAGAAAREPGAGHAEAGRGRPLGPGDVAGPVRLDGESAARLVVVAARLAAGFFRPTNRREIVWVEGDSQLAVGIGGVGITTGDGVVFVTIPVRCDQSGRADVTITFAVGGPDRPAGLYAATPRRPTGPALVVDVWGDALVAFAWQTLLGLAAQVAGAVGKDGRGNILVPAELSATSDGLSVLPMARHRFAGSSGLKPARG